MGREGSQDREHHGHLGSGGQSQVVAGAQRNAGRSRAITRIGAGLWVPPPETASPVTAHPPE